MKSVFRDLLSFKADFGKDMTNVEFAKRVRSEEKVSEIRSVLKAWTNWMAMPLYLAFWIADILYVPQLKWEFLAVRFAVIPICLIIQRLALRATNFREAQWVAFAFNFAMASTINYMIFRIADPTTPYYAGLNLVALGNLAFIPWTHAFYALGALVIFAPYYAIVLSHIHSAADAQGIVLNSFFIISTIVMMFIIRSFNEMVRQREVLSRLALKDEIENRDGVIKVKAAEAVKLSALSSQFSPQVVAAIREGKIDLTSRQQRSHICAIFVDIVNSTERVTRIDKDKFDAVISRFMDDSIKILLKFDITVDKFLGDGILAFCNDPVRYDNYVERVLNAALEIRSQVASNQEFYENYWKNELQIRVGVAVGFANVGFYGNEKYFRSYTAIGPVINLASRLCSSADPNQIMIDHEVFELIGDTKYETKLVGKKTLKGFESDVIKTYEVVQGKNQENMPFGTYDCPECNTILGLDTDEHEIFVFKCRTCGYVLRNTQPTRAAA